MKLASVTRFRACNAEVASDAGDELFESYDFDLRVAATQEKECLNYAG